MLVQVLPRLGITIYYNIIKSLIITYSTFSVKGLVNPICTLKRVESLKVNNSNTSELTEEINKEIPIKSTGINSKSIVN